MAKNNKSKKASTAKKFVCRTCKRHFATKQALMQHLKDRPSCKVGNAAPSGKKQNKPASKKSGSFNMSQVKAMIQTELLKHDQAAPKGEPPSTIGKKETLAPNGNVPTEEFQLAFPNIHSMRHDDEGDNPLYTSGLLDGDIIPLPDAQQRQNYIFGGIDPWTSIGKHQILADYFGVHSDELYGAEGHCYANDLKLTPKDLWAAMYTRFRDSSPSFLKMIPICPGFTSFHKFEELAKHYTQYRFLGIDMEITQIAGKDASGATLICYTENWRHAPFFNKTDVDHQKELVALEDLPISHIIPASATTKVNVHIPGTGKWKFTSGADPDDYLSGVLYIYYKGQDAKLRPSIRATPRFVVSGQGVLDNTLSLSLPVGTSTHWNDQHNKAVKYLPNSGTVQDFNFVGDKKVLTEIKAGLTSSGVHYTIEEEESATDDTFAQASGFILANVSNVLLKTATAQLASYLTFQGQRLLGQ